MHGAGGPGGPVTACQGAPGAAAPLEPPGPGRPVTCVSVGDDREVGPVDPVSAPIVVEVNTHEVIDRGARGSEAKDDASRPARDNLSGSLVDDDTGAHGEFVLRYVVVHG